MKRTFVIFRGRSWHVCMVKKVGCSEFGSENSGASHGQNAERASVVMLLLVFGQQIFSPVLPIFIVFAWSVVIVAPSLQNQCSLRTWGSACFWEYTPLQWISSCSSEGSMDCLFDVSLLRRDWLSDVLHESAFLG